MAAIRRPRTDGVAARLDRRLVALVLPMHHEEGDDDERRRAAHVVFAFAGLACVLGLAGALLLPRYHGPDEKAHVAYVEALISGDLPTLDTPVPRDGGAIDELPLAYGGSDRLVTFDARGDVWVANHPPLTYLLAAPATAVAAHVGWDEAAPLILRGLSAVGFAIGLVATASVAHALFPARWGVAATATGLAALAPTLVGNAGYGYTDGVAFAVGTCSLAAILRIAADGPSRRRLVTLIALLSAAALTRSSLLPLVLLGAFVWLVVAPGRSKLLTAVVLAVPALVAGWFYARNLDLYGSITGADRLYEKFDRPRAGTTTDVLAAPRVWLGLWQALWSQSGNGTHLGTGNPRLGEPAQNLGSGLVVGALLLLAATAGAARAVLRRRLPWPSPHWSSLPWLPWAVALGWVAATLVGVASFLAGGGSPHGRYLLPALPVFATLLAAGLQGLSRRLHAPAAAVVALAAVHLVLLSGLDTTIVAMNLPAALEPPAWADLVVWVLAAVALGLLVGGVSALDRLRPGAPRPPEPTSVP
jgi:hypothetical protein